MSRVWLFLIFLPFTFLLVNGRKLTTEENDRNAERCGVHFLGEESDFEKRLSKRSFGGRRLKPNEYPWTVILKLKEGFCSGVQISPRHILTVAHCVLDFDIHFNGLQCSLNRSYSAVSVMSNPKDVFVIIGLTTKDPNNGTISQHYKALISAKKITVHNFEFCQIYNDLALIELSENVSEAASVPICMPSENMQLHGVFYASGSGVDCAIARNTLIDQDQGECGQRVVAQKFYGVDEPSHKILAQAFSKSPRPGDGGGPLFQVDKSDIHTLVGITSHTYDDEKWKSDTSGNFLGAYVDVRAYLDWICKHSGVCPVEDTSSEETPPLNPFNGKQRK
ncbi:hypothetical protein Aduo_019202 [Ancylostoma duodenale]